MAERHDIADWFRGFIMEQSFLHRYPHYAYVLSQMTTFHDPTMEVMGVSYQRGQLFLHVNTDFFMRSPQYLRGVLLHEVHHVVLGHLTRPALRNVAHTHIMTIAMEISANEYINELLPGDPLTLDRFADKGILPGQSTRERYEILREAMERGEPLSGYAKQCVDTHHDWGVGFPHGDDNTPEAAQSHRSDKPVQRVIRRALAQGDELCIELKRHGVRIAGRESGELLEELLEVEEEPITFVDWRAALQMFVARMRAPRRTYSRPNRRFPHRVGVVPGRVHASGSGDKPNLLVAIDTSASVSYEELLEIARHLQLLHALAAITIVECDVVIQRVYPFQGKLNAVQGRGGTDLRPVFADEMLRQYRPDGIVYFTDGYGPYPEEAPAVPTLWVLTVDPEQHPFDCPWGEKAHFLLPEEWD